MINENAFYVEKREIVLGVVIFLVFIAIIVFLIVKYIQADRETKSGEETTDYSDYYKKSVIVPEKKPQLPSYAAIYEYNSRRNVKICRCCDGENPVPATRCEICGEQIN